MRYDTGNPVEPNGSSDPRDLYDNSANADLYVNGADFSFNDRTGESRRSIRGMEKDYQDLLERSAFESIHLMYAPGVVVDRATQLIERDGFLYRVTEQADLPLTLSGDWLADAPKLSTEGDRVLRQDLASTLGAGLVGSTSGSTVQDLLDVVESLETPDGAGLVLSKSGLPVQSYLAAEKKFTAASFFGSHKSAVVMVLGDSNAEGAGGDLGNYYPDGYLGLFYKAVFNQNDYGQNADRGFRHEVITRMSSAMVNGVSSTGTLIAGGMNDSRLSLAPGQAIQITGRSISSADVFYKPTLSSGSLEFRLNGVLYKTASLSSTGGTAYTYPSPIFNTLFAYTTEEDIIEIRSVGGTVVVSGIMAIKSSDSGAFLYSNIRQGWGLDEFAVDARVTESAEHANSSFGASTPRLVCICLGTNNIIGVVGLQKSPADYITALDVLIGKYRAALIGTVSFAVWVPPKPIDALPLGTYNQYVEAIRIYCETNNIHCIRMDQTILGDALPELMADPRHFNSTGHALAARALCDSLGVVPKFYTPKHRLEITRPQDNQAVTLLGSWTNIYTLRTRPISGGKISFSGVVQANSSSSGDIGTVVSTVLPSRPMYLSVTVSPTSGNPEQRQLVLSTLGVLTVSGPANWNTVSLDGVTYDFSA